MPSLTGLIFFLALAPIVVGWLLLPVAPALFRVLYARAGAELNGGAS